MLDQAAWPGSIEVSSEIKALPRSAAVEALPLELRGNKRTGFVKKVFVALTIVVALAGVAGWVFWPRPIARPDYMPRIPGLRAPELFVYPPARTPLRATIIFFGNDVGFWQPHQQLAAFLSKEGYAVVGFDLRNLLEAIPDAPQAEREVMIGAAIATLMSESQAEFRGEKLPLVLMGHSLGAEVAIWAAAHVSRPRAAGVVAISPGGRMHLAITASDFLSSALPTGPGSFKLADVVRSVPADVRIALVRGDKDAYRGADSEIMPAGAGRLRKFIIPFASHSLKRIVIAKYVVRDALEWVTGR